MGTKDFLPKRRKCCHSVFIKYHNYREENGFTLLELIIALSILTVIVVLTFSAMRLGIKAWETGDERIDFLYRVKYIVDLIEKEISSSYPYYFSKDGANKNKILAFKGLQHSINFISSIVSYDPSVSPGGFREVTFYLDVDEEKKGKQMMMKEKIIKPYQVFGKTKEENIRSIVLLEGVQDLNFRYYRLKSHSSEKFEYDGEWVENFTFTEEDEKKNNMILPRAIEVTMVIQAGKEGTNESIKTFYLPPFVVLLNAGMEFRFNKK